MPTTFFEHQARYRRTPWRWTVLAAAAVVVMALPLSMVLTPILYLGALIVLHLIDRIVDVPAGVWAVADGMAGLIPLAWHAYQSGSQQLITLAGLAVMLVAPGAITIIAVWAAMRRLLASAGLEATLRALGARGPQNDVAEECRFRRTVEEMSGDAGINPPPVWITEHLSPNMALVGMSFDRAGVVVSRRLLNTCDAAEIRALVAHLIASLVHDDPAIALRLESVYLTGAALNALVNAPFGRAGQRVVAATVRAVGRRQPRPDDVKTLEVLLQEWGSPANDLTRFFERNRTTAANVWRALVRLLLLPLHLLNMAVLVTADLLETGFVGPILAAAWRRRRYLADKYGVELAHSPSQLARALHNISGVFGDPGWVPARLQTIVASDVKNPIRTPGGLTNSHPPIAKRLKRLAARGAILTWEPRRTASRGGTRMLEIAGSVVLVPVLALNAYLTAVVVIAVTLLAIGATAVTLAAIHSLFQLLQ